MNRHSNTVTQVTAEQIENELRQADRKRTLKGGKIVYRGSNCLMDCIVYDFSLAGAKIRPADPPKCPESFSLELTDGRIFHCKVIWQSGDWIGVRFDKN